MNWSKRVMILLAVSIGLNLVLAGVLVGSRFARRDRDRDRSSAFPPPPGRPGFDGALSAHRAELGERRRASARARSEIQAILGREPLDRAALDVALGKLRTETQQSQELLHRALGDAAVKAAPEQRRELGKWLSMGRGRGSFRDRRPGPPAD